MIRNNHPSHDGQSKFRTRVRGFVYLLRRSDDGIVLGGHSLGRGVWIRPKVDEWRRLGGAYTQVQALDTSFVQVSSNENKLFQYYQLIWGGKVGGNITACGAGSIPVEFFGMAEGSSSLGIRGTCNSTFSSADINSGPSTVNAKLEDRSNSLIACMGKRARAWSPAFTT